MAEIRQYGIAVQLIIYFCNAGLWIVSILTIIYGLFIGMQNRTLRLDSFKDLIIVTPATIFITYGMLLFGLTMVGCFSSVTAGKIINSVYSCLTLIYIIFDVCAGYGFLYSADPFLNFYNELNTSISYYKLKTKNASGGNEGEKYVGIIPVPVNDYWDHLQTRGKCCGLLSYEDYVPSNYSHTTHDLPDSCCNDDYQYRYCGSQVLRHPDSDQHSITDIIYSRGCMDIFPELVRNPADPAISIMGRFILSMLVVCLLFTIVIMLLVILKKFRREQGIDNWEYVPTAKQSRASVIQSPGGDKPIYRNDKGGSGEHGVDPLVMSNKHRLSENNNAVVHPEQEEEFIGENNERVRRRSDPTRPDKKLRFKESGPKFIP